MGFIKPRLAEVEPGWADGRRSDRIRPMAQDWAEAGFGTPDAVLVLYALKIALYALGAALVVSLTPGIGTLGNISTWWTEPIAFQKVVVFTLLFEVLGLGCGFGPLTMRFLPPIGGFLYWLRPGTIRLPPWPNHLPGTAGTRRTPLDVALYVGVIAAAIWALAGSPEVGLGALAPESGALGTLAVGRVLPLLVVVPLLGLRDKTIFLAARSEVYLVMCVAFLFGGVDMIVALKLVMVAIWWGAATSKLNAHFPFVVSVMLSNSPLLRNKALKRRFFRSHPDDLTPSRLSAALAHGGTVFEFVVPAVLLFSTGGALTTAAAAAMIGFHLFIISSLPLGVPLEWNVFMIYGTCVLFVHDAAWGVGDVSNPLVWALIASLVVLVAAGNYLPERFSFLVAMRYYAGNWATSLWSFTPEATERFEHHVVKSATMPAAQLERLYGSEVAESLAFKGYAFRSMHSHGRALFGLLPRALGGDGGTRHVSVDGEFVAGAALGWNFGEGHLHHQQLLDALQERCAFEPGEVRVIMLESQQMGTPRQRYRLVDAAAGEFERGTVAVADMVCRQPWTDEIPVTLEAEPGAS